METIYGANDYRNYELYHHGIQGQKWGKKQGPPYPLDPEDHSASEQKAGWRQSLKADTKDRIKSAKIAAKEERKIDKLENKSYTESRQAKIDRLNESRNKRIADLSDKEIELGRRYYEQNRAASTAGVVGFVLFGTPGAIGSYAATRVANSVSSSGKETKRLRKEVEAENEQRQQGKDLATGQKLAKDISKASKSGGKYAAGKNAAAKDPEVQKAAERVASETKSLNAQLDKVNQRAFNTEQKEAARLGQKNLTSEQIDNLSKTNKQYAKDVADDKRIRDEISSVVRDAANSVSDGYGIRDRDVRDSIRSAIDSESRKNR